MSTALPESIRGDLDVVDGNAWPSRVRDASYKSRAGTVVRFDFETAPREVTLRGSAYSFPGVNEQFVQRTGHSSRSYPMRCLFSGPQHDLAATAFEQAILESPSGRLTHPIHGEFDVVPFGSMRRRNDMVNEANLSIVEITFMTSLPSAYPGRDRDRRSEILRALDGFDVAAAQQFADDTDLQGAIEQANERATVTDFLDTVELSLGTISAATDRTRAEFQDQIDVLNRSIDVLVGQPLILARQVTELLKTPAQAAAGIRDRLEGYADFAQSIFGSEQANGSVDPALIGASVTGISASIRARARNDVLTSDLFTASAVSGSSLSTVENDFRTKPEAIAAALSVTAQFDDFVSWRDGALANVGVVDTGASYQAVKDVVDLVAGYLVEVSFSLVPERIVVLDRARTIIDLSAELYGAVDDETLNFLISTNELTGSEILELPRGKPIAYYV